MSSHSNRNSDSNLIEIPSVFGSVNNQSVLDLHIIQNLQPVTNY